MTVTQQDEVSDRAQRVLYTAWNMWKERCRRPFDNQGMTDQRLQKTIQSDVENGGWCGTPPRRCHPLVFWWRRWTCRYDKLHWIILSLFYRFLCIRF
jgi:hypothetical protein